jgi:hypothetical protein
MGFSFRQIPPGIVRITVLYGTMLFSSDIRAEDVGLCLTEFEIASSTRIDLAPLRGTIQGAEGASSIAHWAVERHRELDMPEVISLAGLWIALYQPDIAAGRRMRFALDDLVKRDGGAWVMCTTDEYGVEWSFAVSLVSLARCGEAALPWVRRPAEATLH